MTRSELSGRHERLFSGLVKALRQSFRGNLKIFEKEVTFADRLFPVGQPLCDYD
jgi:hypothetical protein